MGAFTSKVDIGNRSLQHCGAARMDATLGFNEQSRNAAEVAFNYDKAREVELRKRFWTFAIKRTVIRPIDTNTMRLDPALWASITTYFVGSIVADQSGNLWISRIRNNLNNDPLLSNYWDPYFGPRSVSLYDSTVAYSSGELVYTTAGDGTYRAYLSLIDGNEDNPAIGTAYDATVTYFKNQVVTSASVAYMSLIDLNTGNTPASSAAAWNSGTTYTTGQAVTGSDGIRYTSVGNGNLGNDPTLTSPTSWTNTGTLTAWTTAFTGGTGSGQWLQIGGAEFPMGVGLTTLNVIYPAGSGPSWQSTSNNVYLKPAGYLRLAPQNPKPGMSSLGGPSGSRYDDWLFEGDYLITSDGGPIVLRFVADFTDVARMDADFCEAVAARIAFAICDTITQSNSQISIVAKTFKEWDSDAKTIDGIESGYTDPPEDELIAVRY